jgi:hypothetical protein
MCLISCFISSLVYLNSTIRYTIHDTIQNITIHDIKYDSTSMLASDSSCASILIQHIPIEREQWPRLSTTYMKVWITSTIENNNEITA